LKKPNTKNYGIFLIFPLLFLPITYISFQPAFAEPDGDPGVPFDVTLVLDAIEFERIDWVWAEDFDGSGEYWAANDCTPYEKAETKKSKQAWTKIMVKKCKFPELNFVVKMFGINHVGHNPYSGTIVKTVKTIGLEVPGELTVYGSKATKGYNVRFAPTIFLAEYDVRAINPRIDLNEIFYETDGLPHWYDCNPLNPIDFTYAIQSFERRFNTKLFDIGMDLAFAVTKANMIKIFASAVNDAKKLKKQVDAVVGVYKDYKTFESSWSLKTTPVGITKKNFLATGTVKPLESIPGYPANSKVLITEDFTSKYYYDSAFHEGRKDTIPYIVRHMDKVISAKHVFPTPKNPFTNIYWDLYLRAPSIDCSYINNPKTNFEFDTSVEREIEKIRQLGFPVEKDYHFKAREIYNPWLPSTPESLPNPRYDLILPLKETARYNMMINPAQAENFRDWTADITDGEGNSIYSPSKSLAFDNIAETGIIGLQISAIPIDPAYNEREILFEMAFYDWDFMLFDDPFLVDDPILAMIPPGIKDTASAWADGAIPDKDFLAGIGYMVEEGIIQVSAIPSGETQDSVPAWVKDTAEGWADGAIPDKDFLAGIGYMIEVGIITLQS